MIKKKEEDDILVPWLDGAVPWVVASGAVQASYWNYPKLRREKGKIEWRANKPFKASFKVNRFTGSTSSTQIILVNTANDKIFHMRADDFVHALLQSACVFGIFVGEWKFRKTGGMYYGLVFVG